jgi:hypothetical protein
MAELTAISRGMSGQRFELRVDDQPAGMLRLSVLGRSARLDAAGGEFDMSRQGFFGGTHFLQQGNKTLARIEKTALFQNLFDVHLGDVRLAMQRTGFMGRTFEITDVDGRNLGGAERQRGWRLHATLRLEGDWPLPVLAFVLWVPLRVWTAERAASS